MAKNDFSAESPSNFEQKCTCVLVLDVSGSMSGQPIDELNKGLQEFYQEIKGDSTTSNRLEVSIVTFGDKIDTLIEPSLVDNFSMPHLDANQPSTRLVDGIREGIAKVDARKAWYKQTGQPYYRPWLITITDGSPDGGQDVNGLASEIKAAMDNKRFNFFAVGVQGADMNTLQKISHPNMQPAMLQGLKFGQFFKWLSASMTTVTSSKDGEKINLPSPANWMQGFQV